jgi:hypothetical protein
MQENRHCRIRASTAVSRCMRKNQPRMPWIDSSKNRTIVLQSRVGSTTKRFPPLSSVGARTQVLLSTVNLSYQSFISYESMHIFASTLLSPPCSEFLQQMIGLLRRPRRTMHRFCFLTADGLTMLSVTLRWSVQCLGWILAFFHTIINYPSSTGSNELT